MNDSIEKRIAVVGNKDTILIFKALGMDVYFTEEMGTEQILKNLVENGYPIIFVTEREAVIAGDLIDSYADKPFPIIIPIPDGVNNFGLGTDKIAANMKKALGSAGGIYDKK